MTLPTSVCKNGHTVDESNRWKAGTRNGVPYFICKICNSSKQRIDRALKLIDKPPKQPITRKSQDRDRLHARFDSFVRKTDTCWIWMGRTRKEGYGYIDVAYSNSSRGRPVHAHRVSYELYKGPIPKGYTVDHVCHTLECRLGEACLHRKCVNPDHLELSVSVDNIRRTHRYKYATHCIHGHPFDESNTYTYKGQRICKTCAKLRQREYRDR